MRKKLYPIIFFFLLAIFGFLSCVQVNSGAGITFGEQFRIEYDQTIRLEDGTEVRFLELKKDIRCPEDALCPYEGEAVILIAIERDDRLGDVFEISIPGFIDRYSRDGHIPKKYWEYRFTLLQLDPYPLPDHSEPKQRYVATLIVEKSDEEVPE